jgi:predicted nuclease with RNAse H fold
MNQDMTVAGIDVGGPKKGLHLVILQGTTITVAIRSPDPLKLLECCLHFDVQAVGIDAPSQWRAAGSARSAEREMARERISCFSTPTKEKADASESGFYGWMINGFRVYEAFARRYPVLLGNAYEGKRVSFETFPHAITCAYLKQEASAKKKGAQRRKLLEDEGIATGKLKSIDNIDAALCALAAQRLIEGTTRAYGDANGGYVFVPKNA